MNKNLHQDYPASVDTLWNVFGDPDYPDRKYKALGISAYEVREFTSTPERISLELLRTHSLPPEKVPAMVRRFLHPHQTLRYVSHWQRRGPDAAEFDLEIIPVGLPVHIRGNGRLEATGPRAARLAIDFTVKVDVPLIGRTAENLVATQIEKSFHEDHAFTLRYLAENTPAT